jgi:hypothetical protein
MDGMSDSDILKEAHEIFAQCQDREQENRQAFEDDVRFARLEEQWPQEIAKKRLDEGRPMHVINKLAPIIRQVVNDARQNKPAISIRPQDRQADPETAEIIGGLIRNIEAASSADIAYDTAVENAVTGGFGYIRVNIDYSHDDTFDKDILIERVPNPLAVYGDPESFSADGSDWNVGFITDQISQEAFKAKYPDAQATDWQGDYPEEWLEDDRLTIAEYWRREEVGRKIIQLSDGQIMDLAAFEAQAEYFYSLGIAPVGSPREVRSYKTTQRIISGVDVLETNEWAGKWIPLVPVYGDEVVLKNKRYLRSLIRSAKGAQERYNYAMSTSTEMWMLAPRMPYIGEEGAFDVDPNWSLVNSQSIPFVKYKRGSPMPQRQPGPQANGALLQEAMGAAEDIKAVTGIYDASLGARSNETSGVAIRERARQGDISTFHFIDNLNRSIRQIGRVIVDLVPKVYTQDRVIRVLGEDGKSQQVVIGQPNDQGRIYDLAVGKYDVTVKAGPSYTTQREETRAEMLELARALPPEDARKLVPMYLRSCDWPGAEDAADVLEGKGEQQQLPPEVQQQFGQMQQVIQQGGQELQRLQMENEQLKQANAIKAVEAQAKDKEADAKLIEAEAKRFAAMNTPPAMQAPPPVTDIGNPFSLSGSI